MREFLYLIIAWSMMMLAVIGAWYFSNINSPQEKIITAPSPLVGCSSYIEGECSIARIARDICNDLNSNEETCAIFAADAVETYGCEL